MQCDPVICVTAGCTVIVIVCACDLNDCYVQCNRMIARVVFVPCAVIMTVHVICVTAMCSDHVIVRMCDLHDCMCSVITVAAVCGGL